MLYLNSIISKGDVTLELYPWYVGIGMIFVAAEIFMLLLFISECVNLVKLSESKRQVNSMTKLKENAIPMIMISAALIILLIAIKLKIEHLEPYKPISLTEVSDLITVDNDKVEIKPLTDKQSKYFYDSQDSHDQIENDKTQTFKIEEETFYNRMYLIDKNNHKSELSEDEMNMIKSKRN